MKHTFLFEPAVWTAKGTFWTADGRDFEAEGRSEISQGKECWMLAARLRVQSTPHVEFVNVYCITPPEKDPLTSRWTSENSSLGKLHGVFTVTGSTIVSMFRSEQGGYQGTEHIKCIHPNHYDACGVLLMADRRLSSWQVELRR